MRPNQRITSTHYTKPHRPMLIRFMNSLMNLLYFNHRKTSLSLEALMRIASKQQKLDDFGDTHFFQPANILLESIHEEAHLNPIGQFITKQRLINVLSNRLRTEYLFKKYPEIAAVELPPITVITGLQRTGTTLLHRLLAADPDTRSLSSWEAINPSPFLDRSKQPILTKPVDPRFNVAKMSERLLGYLHPDFFSVHPVEAHAPEEDCLLLDFAFLSTVPEATLRVPTYSRWVEEQDQTPAYLYMKRLLQLLQWQKPKKRWILKTPHHMEFLETLFAVFPEVKLIQTHRDPCTTIASFCSMIAHGRSVFSDTIDPFEIGRDWSRKIKRMIFKNLEFRTTYPSAPFLDVFYQDFIQDPIKHIQKIYHFLSLELSDTSLEAIRQSLSINTQHKYGKHQYILENFGLDDATLREELAAYYSFFDI